MLKGKAVLGFTPGNDAKERKANAEVFKYTLEAVRVTDVLDESFKVIVFSDDYYFFFPFVFIAAVLCFSRPLIT